MTNLSTLLIKPNISLLLASRLSALAQKECLVICGLYLELAFLRSDGGGGGGGGWWILRYISHREV